MRALLAATILLTSAAWSVEPSRTSPSREARDEERGLTREQLNHYVNAYQPAIRDCYAENVHSPSAKGKLVLSGTVLRNGALIGLTVDAPGVAGGELAMLNQCVRKEVDSWHFPVRRDETIVQFPFLFQKVFVPGAGPQYSCWNPRGCFTKKGKR